MHIIKNTLKHLPYFAIPGAFICANVLFLAPYLYEKGMDRSWAFIISLYGVFVILTVYAVLLFILNSNSNDYSGFKQLFRFNKLTKRQWGAVLFAFIAVTILEQAVFSPTSLAAARDIGGFFSPDKTIVSPFNGELSLPLTEFMGFQTEGALWLIPLWATLLFFNIAGEDTF